MNTQPAIGRVLRPSLTSMERITACASVWEDADTEMLELARHRKVLAEGREDDYLETCLQPAAVSAVTWAAATLAISYEDVEWASNRVSFHRSWSRPDCVQAKWKDR